MDAQFSPCDPLLNRAFEGYVLQPWSTLAGESGVTPLPANCRTGFPGGNALETTVPSLTEMRARIQQNLLIPLPGAENESATPEVQAKAENHQWFAYLDNSGRVIGVCVDKSTTLITTRVLYQPDISHCNHSSPIIDGNLVYAGHRHFVYFYLDRYLDVLSLTVPTLSPDPCYPNLQLQARYMYQFPSGLTTTVTRLLSAAAIVSEREPRVVGVRCLITSRVVNSTPPPTDQSVKFVHPKPPTFGPVPPPSLREEASMETTNTYHKGRSMDRSNDPRWKRPEFYVALVDLPLLPHPKDLSVKETCFTWHVNKVQSFPIYSQFSPGGNDYLLGLSSTNHEPIYQADILDAQIVPNVALPAHQGPFAPTVTPAQPKVPYIWMQTDVDVTVCYELPAHVTSAQLQCKFTRRSVTLDFTSLDPLANPAKFPRLMQRAFYDWIVPNESFWTLERGRILTLYLQKSNEQTRWPYVFQDQEANPDEEVLETLDPNEFVRIQDRLEKYTVDGPCPSTTESQGNAPDLFDPNQSTFRAVGRSLHPRGSFSAGTTSSPYVNDESVLETYDGAMDVDNIERVTLIGWDIAGQVNRIVYPGDHLWLGEAFTRYDWVGSGVRSPSVCLQHDVDGLVYAVDWLLDSTANKVRYRSDANDAGKDEQLKSDTKEDPSSLVPSTHSTMEGVELDMSGTDTEAKDPNTLAEIPTWPKLLLSQGVVPRSYRLLTKHWATFSAFGYVQSSKRDKRFIRFDSYSSPSLPPRFVVVAESRRYLYVYYQPHSPTALKAKHSVIDIQPLLLQQPSKIAGSGEQSEFLHTPTGPKASGLEDQPALDILGLEQLDAETLVVLSPAHVCVIKV
ncbi:hypothetical protein IWQ62_002053 [Dispira parvispora]|uniref:NudC domain-containing protein 1 n=1 Tax=Dispira parvispora TaxID=1520584 RepID=A0A9W8AR75_9FUNG|nr:hypothetical protein IWQ62_002053 [Dispira parvispora]